MDFPAYVDETARTMLRANPDPAWREGSSEPWVGEVVCALMRANATRVAVEIGCFDGYMSTQMLRALSDAPWPTKLWLCELDPQRVIATRNAITQDGLTHISADRVTLVNHSSLEWIPTLADESVDFVWLDGNHELQHVAQEIYLLLPKLAPGGIIAGHDVHGVCELHRLFSDSIRFGIMFGVNWPVMSLDLPRLGPAGGIGLLQRPR